MKMFEGLGFEILEESHINEITPIMKRAFDEDSRRHLNEETGGPDGYDNGDFLRKYGLDKKVQHSGNIHEESYLLEKIL